MNLRVFSPAVVVIIVTHRTIQLAFVGVSLAESVPVV
jgi:hypothetical protein